MAYTSVIHTLVSFSHLVLLIFFFINRDTALIVSTATVPTNTTATAVSHLLDVSGLDPEGGASEFSTWESASVHRILKDTGSTRQSYKGLIGSLQACDARKYGHCVKNAAGHPVRPCNDYNRCDRDMK